MELLCPNCQQRVTVPDQFAGQVMKCPLCSNTFTTPSLPGAGAPAFVPPPSPAPTRPADVEPFAALSPAAPRSEPGPVIHSAAPDPITGDYRHRVSICFSPRVLPWVAVAAMIIVFILMFFPWVGYFPGGMPVATQTAWQAAFGSYTDDPDLAKDPPVSNADHKDQIQPGFSVFQIFFVVFFQLALVAALGVAVLGVVALPLPAIVERFWPWRWAKVSALALVAFLFLVLQLVGGFNLAKGIRDRIQTIGAEHAKTVEANSDPAAKVAAKKEAQSETGLHADAVRYTCAFWTSFWLTLLAVICAVWTYLLSRRPSRPLPRIELVW